MSDKLSKLHNTGTGIRKAKYEDNLDYYKTPDWVTEEFLDALKYDGIGWMSGDTLDPCCGDGAIAKILERRASVSQFHGSITSIDIEDRGYGQRGNFLTHEGEYDFIIMNPPFFYAE